jgi:hypothetical protein
VVEEIGARLLHVSTAPPGAADAWVVGRYAAEVRLHRSQANHQQVSLVVLVDGDAHGVVGRHHQLANALHADLLSPRTAGERIAVLVPTRSIEDWLSWLAGVEERDPERVKGLVKQGRLDPRAIGRAAMERWRGAHDTHEPAGFAEGRGEVARLRVP